MVLKVYISGMSGNKEVKKRQQRVLMILDSKNIKYEIIDITEPGRETDKEFMQNKSTSNGATVSDPEPRHALPPQIFNDDGYCGDYDAFDLANEIDTLEQFLKLEPPADTDTTNNGTPNTISHAAIDSTNDQIESKQENGEANGEDNKENDGSEPNKDDETAEKPENHNNEQKISVAESLNIDPKSMITSQPEMEMAESNAQISDDQEEEKHKRKSALNEEEDEVEQEIIVATTTPITPPSTSIIEITREIINDDTAADDKNTNPNSSENSIDPDGEETMAEEKIVKKPKLDTKLQDNAIDLNNIEEKCNVEKMEKFQSDALERNVLQENIDGANAVQDNEFMKNVNYDDKDKIITKDNEEPVNTINNDSNNEKIRKNVTVNANDNDKEVDESTEAEIERSPTMEKESEGDASNASHQIAINNEENTKSMAKVDE